MNLEAKVLTISDSVHTGEREDASGAALEDALVAAGFRVVERRVAPDDVQTVAAALRHAARDFYGLIVTTGGTGFGPRDITPEATATVLERSAPGLAEAMRAVNALGRLSRGTAGTIGGCLIVNTPGSPRGAAEHLAAVIDVLPHALELLAGGHPHPGVKTS